MKKINEHQAYFLLFCTIMNQSQKAELTLLNAQTLLVKLLEKNKMTKSVCNLHYSDIYDALNGSPALHRFPRRMAKYIFDSLSVVKNKFNEDAMCIFGERDANINEDKIIENLLLFPGIGEHKAEITATIVTFYCNGDISQQEYNKISSKCPRIESTIWDEFKVLNSFAE